MAKLVTLIVASLLAVTAIASGADAGFNVSKATVIAQAESGALDAADAIEETRPVDEIENSSISDVGCKTFSRLGWYDPGRPLRSELKSAVPTM